MTSVLGDAAAAPPRRPLRRRPLPRRPLRRRPDFRRLWIGETTSSLGTSVTSVALPLVALTVLHANVLTVSVLTGVAWIPWVVIGLPAGAWVDRLPKRPVMIACDVVSLLALVSVPLAAWTGVLSLPHLFAAAVVVGVSEVFFSTAYRTFLPALVPDDDLVEANSHLQASESAAQVAGPGVAGLLAQAAGAATGLLVDAATFVVSLVCLLGIRVGETATKAPRRSLRLEIGEGLRFVLHDHLLRTLMIFGGLANLVLSGYDGIQVAYLVRDLGTGSGLAGLLIAVGQAGGIGGALFAPRVARRIGSARTLAAAKLVTLPLALLVPLATQGPGVAFFVVGQAALVAGVVAGNVVQRAFTQAYCPLHLMGRINTSTQVVNFGAIPIGALVGGVLATALGYRAALWILLGGMLVASLVLLTPSIQANRDLPTRAEVRD